MEIILLEKIQNLGDLGALVNVKSGYARNYLIPQGKAVWATADNKVEFEQQRAELESVASDKLNSARARASKMEGVNLEIVAKASEEGHLFGSVTNIEIAEAMVEKELEIQKSEIILSEGPIKTIGDHSVHISLHPEVQLEIAVTVIAEQ